MHFHLRAGSYFFSGARVGFSTPRKFDFERNIRVGAFLRSKGGFTFGLNTRGGFMSPGHFGGDSF